MRRATIGVAVSLLLAACATTETTTTTEAPAAAPAATEAPATEPPATEATATTSTVAATTTTVPATQELLLSKVEMENEDPLLTLLILESVTVTRDGDFLLFGFAETTESLTVLFDTAAGDAVDCFTENGIVECGVFSADQNYQSEQYRYAGEIPPYTVVAPVRVEGDQVVVTINGTDYTSPTIRFMVGPVMVQINPNTGGLASAVTRELGQATAAELAAAGG